MIPLILLSRKSVSPRYQTAVILTKIINKKKKGLNTELSNQNCKMQTKQFGKECNCKRTSKSMPLAEHKLKKRREAESSLVAAQEGLWC